MSWIDELRDKVQIADVVRRYISFEKSLNNGNYMVKCPFHQEKTASMSVNQAKNMFYCFGCGVGGDPIAFVQKIEKIQFMEACTKLADWYGVHIRKLEPPSELVALNKIMVWATSNLRGEPLEYLYKRGLTDRTIDLFKIGYITSNFPNFCQENGIDNALLDKIGFKQNIKHIFQNRIVFPIFNKSKQVIGFGARCIYGTNPKYINTAENDIFHKKEALYGINLVKSGAEYVMIVEGYFDVCIATQVNINAVAPMGTASSMKQVEELWELSSEVIVCFDADVAGQNASAKLAREAIKSARPGKIISFLDLPNGADPGSYFASNSSEILSSRQSLQEKLWGLFDPKSIAIPEKRIEAFNNLLDLADSIKDPNLKFLYVKSWKEKWFSKNEPKLEFNAPDPEGNYLKILIGSIVYYPEIWDEVSDYVLSLNLHGIFFEIREIFVSNQKIPEDVLLNFTNLYPKTNLIKIAPFLKNSDNLIKNWMEVYSFYCKMKKNV